MSTSNGASASQSALATAAPGGIVPLSPMPRIPIGVTGEGSSVWSSSIFGRSAVVGMK